MGRRRLVLGHQHDGEAGSLAVRGRTILIAGEPGTGKSWLAGLLCEQLILQGYCVCIIDPEGDYHAAGGASRCHHAWRRRSAAARARARRALRHPDVSVIVDLSKISHHEKARVLAHAAAAARDVSAPNGAAAQDPARRGALFPGGTGSRRTDRPRTGRLHLRHLSRLGAGAIRSRGPPIRSSW